MASAKPVVKVAHPFAKYQQGKRTNRVHYSTLGPPTNNHIALAGKSLRSINGQVALYIRQSRSGLYHFATLTGTPGKRRTFKRAENDPLHNKERDKILAEIKKAQRVHIKMRFFQTSALYHDDVLAKANNAKYEWEKEVSRILSNHATVRHDLFGFRPSIAMSVRFPSVAIEVIFEHAPETRALLAMLSATKHTPYIVLLHFLKAPPKRHFQLSSNKGTLTIRSSFAIAEGKVFKNGREIPKVRTKDDFKRIAASIGVTL